MFKKTVLFIFLVLISANVFSVRLVEPLSKELSENSFVGSIVPGQSLELIISKEFGFFDSLVIDSKLPSFFVVEVEDYLESFKIIINTDEKTPLTNYFLKFSLSGKSSESVSVFFSVENNLLDATLLNYSSTISFGESAKYDLLLVNNSDADAIFRIKLYAPWYLLGESFFGKEYYNEVLVPKQSKLNEQIKIFSKIHGTNTFVSEIFFQNDSLSKKFTLYSKVLPNLQYKLKSSLNGFPFFSISLLPNYFLTSIISLFF